jgi:hypothetical protein
MVTVVSSRMRAAGAVLTGSVFARLANWASFHADDLSQAGPDVRVWPGKDGKTTTVNQ